MDNAQLPIALNFAGPKVAALQEGLIELGFSIPETEYNVAQEEFTFGVGTLTAVLKSQAASGLKPTGIVDAATQLALDSALESEQSGHTIQGQIQYQSGRPAANVRIGLFRRGFGPVDSEAVAETETNEFGFYMMDYLADEAERFDVQIIPAERAEPIDLSKTVPISGIKLRPLKHEVLNLVAPAKLEPVAVEYAALTNDLAAAIADDEGEREDPLAKLAEAREIVGTPEMDEQRDISFLHDGTGRDARLIALAHDTDGTVDESETEGTVDVSVYGPALRVRRTIERIIGS